MASSLDWLNHKKATDTDIMTVPMLKIVPAPRVTPPRLSPPTLHKLRTS